MHSAGLGRRWRMLGLVAMLAAILSIAAVACSDDDDEDGDATPVATESDTTPSATEGDETPTEGVAGEMNITSIEYSFEDVPASQPGGLTTITLDNIGGEEHQAIFFKLNDGTTLEQFQTALQADETGVQALALASGAGGVNVLPAGESGEVQHDLAEGTHVMLCFVPAADGVPHLAKGMSASFEVTAPEGEPPELPAPDATITTTDFAFPDTTLASGEQTVQIVNSGAQNHEVGIVKLEEGFTVDQLRAMFTEEPPTPAPGETPEEQGPPPFSAAGGYGAIAPADDGYMFVNLEAGNYAMICFFPDANQGGAPHVALGMVGSLTVE